MAHLYHNNTGVGGHSLRFATVYDMMCTLKHLLLLGAGPIIGKNQHLNCRKSVQTTLYYSSVDYIRWNQYSWVLMSVHDSFSQVAEVANEPMATFFLHFLSTCRATFLIFWDLLGLDILRKHYTSAVRQLFSERTWPIILVPPYVIS